MSANSGEEDFIDYNEDEQPAEYSSSKVVDEKDTKK